MDESIISWAEAQRPAIEAFFESMCRECHDFHDVDQSCPIYVD